MLTCEKSSLFYKTIKFENDYTKLKAHQLIVHYEEIELQIFSCETVDFR